jgi:hypothetical protein
VGPRGTVARSSGTESLDSNRRIEYLADARKAAGRCERVLTMASGPFRQLIRELLRGSVPTAERILRSSAFDSSGFVTFAEREGLAGLAHVLLCRSQLATALPPPVARVLRAVHRRQWARNRELLAEMATIAEALRPRAPDLVFLKGPLLARRLYGDLGTRAISDVDLLVRWSEMEGVERSLLAMGYRRVSAVPIARPIARIFTHHFTYRRERVLVEVHWVLQNHAGLHIDHDAVRARAILVDVAGTTFRATALEDELVLQMLSTFTDLQLGVARLRSLVDQHALLLRLDPEVSWDAYFAAREAEGLGRITVAMLGLVIDVLDCAKELPAVAALVENLGREIGIRRPAMDESTLRTSAWNLRERLRWLRLCDVPLPLAIGWWMLSLPARLVVHRPS